MTRRCFIRADAAVAIGGGHAVRCLALANALVAAGWHVTFVSTAQTIALVPDIARFHDYVLASEARAESDLRELISRLPAVDLIIFDGYEFDAAYEESFRNLAPVLVAIDDYPRRQHVTDILIDQTLGREVGEYRHLIPPKAGAFCGATYAMLRAPFAQKRASGLPIVAQRDRLRVLVNFGLTDAANATGLALDGMIGLNITATIVIGRQAPFRASIENVIHRGGSDWCCVGEVDAQQMADLISDADLVIGAPGSATYERCCLGRPSALVLVAENQRSNAQQLVDAGGAVLLGEIGMATPAQLRAPLAQLLSNRAVLRGMAEEAAKITDGRGASRVAGILSTFVGL